MPPASPLARLALLGVWSMGLMGIVAVACAAVLWWDVLPYLRRNQGPAELVAAWFGTAGALGVGALGCVWISRHQPGRRIPLAVRLAATSATLIALPLVGRAVMWLSHGGPTSAAAGTEGAAVEMAWGMVIAAWLATACAVTSWSLTVCSAERLRLPAAPWPDEETTRRRRRVSLLAGVLACGGAVLLAPDWCARLLAPLDPAPTVGGRTASRWLAALRQPAGRPASLDALVRCGPAAGPVLVALATEAPTAEFARRAWWLRRVDEVAAAFGAARTPAGAGAPWHPDLDVPSEWREAAIDGLARVGRADAGGIPCLVRALAQPDDGHPPLLGEALSFFGTPAIERLIARRLDGTRAPASAVLAALDAEHPQLRRHPIEQAPGVRVAPTLADDEVFHRTPWLAQIGPIGPADARIDLVVFGDGYAVADLAASGKFWTDARRATAALFAVEPFRRHRARFNVHVVVPDWPTSEGGYAARGTAVCAPFDCQRGWLGVERLIVPRQRFRAWTEARRVVRTDVALLLVDRDGHGGTATTIGTVGFAICPTDVLDTRVVAHEVGHALGGLGDEYANDPQLAAINPLPSSGDLRAPNVALAHRLGDGSPAGLRRSLKWADLAEKRWGVNWPSYAYVWGGYYRPEGVVRPTDTCIMNNHVSSTDFCYVCEAALEAAIEAATGGANARERNPAPLSGSACGTRGRPCESTWSGCGEPSPRGR